MDAGKKVAGLIFIIRDLQFVSMLCKIASHAASPTDRRPDDGFLELNSSNGANQPETHASSCSSQVGYRCIK